MSFGLPFFFLNFHVVLPLRSSIHKKCRGVCDAARPAVIMQYWPSALLRARSPCKANTKQESERKRRSSSSGGSGRNDLLSAIMWLCSANFFCLALRMIVSTRNSQTEDDFSRSVLLVRLQSAFFFFLLLACLLVCLLFRLFDRAANRPRVLGSNRMQCNPLKGQSNRVRTRLSARDAAISQTKMPNFHL